MSRQSKLSAYYRASSHNLLIAPVCGFVFFGLLWMLSFLIHIPSYFYWIIGITTLLTCILDLLNIYIIQKQSKQNNHRDHRGRREKS